MGLAATAMQNPDPSTHHTRAYPAQKRTGPQTRGGPGSLRMTPSNSSASAAPSGGRIQPGRKSRVGGSQTRSPVGTADADALRCASYQGTAFSRAETHGKKRNADRNTYCDQRTPLHAHHAARMNACPDTKKGAAEETAGPSLRSGRQFF